MAREEKELVNNAIFPSRQSQSRSDENQDWREGKKDVSERVSEGRKRNRHYYYITQRQQEKKREKQSFRKMLILLVGMSLFCSNMAWCQYKIYTYATLFCLWHKKKGSNLVSSFMFSNSFWLRLLLLRCRCCCYVILVTLYQGSFYCAQFTRRTTRNTIMLMVGWYIGNCVELRLPFFDALTKKAKTKLMEVRVGKTGGDVSMYFLVFLL